MADTLSSIATNSSHLTFAEDSPNFEIPLYPSGDGAEFHFKNDPNDPDQRDTVTLQKGRVNIRCEHKDIIHGFFSDEVDDLHTLVVFKFRFDPNGIAARIKEAHAVLKFSGMEIGKPDPEVVAMYPDDSYCVGATKQHEQVVGGADANIGASAAGAQVGATLKLEKTIDRGLVRLQEGSVRRTPSRGISLKILRQKQALSQVFKGLFYSRERIWNASKRLYLSKWLPIRFVGSLLSLRRVRRTTIFSTTPAELPRTTCEPMM